MRAAVPCFTLQLCSEANGFTTYLLLLHVVNIREALRQVGDLPRLYLVPRFVTAGIGSTPHVTLNWKSRRWMN